MNYTIREMTASDFERVTDIFACAIAEGKSTFRSVAPTAEQWNKAHLENCRFVLESGGKIVGWCAVSPISSVPAYGGVVEASIYFDKDFRGVGLGTALYKHLICEAEKCGIWCLYSSIFSSNTRSIALHKACGFRTIGIREKIAKDIFGVWQDTTLMELRNKII